MVHHIQLTDHVSTITSLIKKLVHQAEFAQGLKDLYRETAEKKNQRFMAFWEITLQKAPESTWHWVTQKSREPAGLFVGADFIQGLRSIQ